MIRKDEGVANIYAVIASCQQNGNCLLDEVKEKLTMEVKNNQRGNKKIEKNLRT